MTIGQHTTVKGYVTTEGFLKGRPLDVIERFLGFHKGRLANGARFFALTRMPRSEQFDLAAYSMVAGHRFQMPGGLNVPKLKENAIESWALTGLKRLIKVEALIPHNQHLNLDDQYPPGAGVPQWRILEPGVKGVVVDIVLDYPSGVFRPRC
jgi:hypothetical protein